MTREEAKRKAAAGAIALLPTGATEQHGPHLPVGTDTYAVETVVRRAAALVVERVPVVVTPTLPFGSSQHHLAFGGTMSVSTATYYQLVRDLVESLITGGFSRIIIINGHGGNHEVIQLVVRDIALEQPVKLGAASYWQMAADAFAATDAAQQGRVPGHAGAFETSLMMALQPDCVVEPRPSREDDPSIIDPPTLAKRLRVEQHRFWHLFDGYTDSPARASADHGETYLDLAAKAVAETISDFDRATAERQESVSSN
jgi:creatinine amidohydrolase